MKNGFTIIEVSILFVIFLIVAFLVAPLSLDDTLQAKNASKWRRVQTDFENIFYSINMQKTSENYDFKSALSSTLSEEIKSPIKPYKITYFNGTFPSETYRFTEFFNTYGNASLAYKLFDEPQDGVLGVLMYDVNGHIGPNAWGKDVFGYNIYNDKLEPIGKKESINEQKLDCSKNGTGLYCSNYYLIGGGFN